MKQKTLTVVVAFLIILSSIVAGSNIVCAKSHFNVITLNQETIVPLTYDDWGFSEAYAYDFELTSCQEVTISTVNNSQGGSYRLISMNDGESDFDEIMEGSFNSNDLRVLPEGKYRLFIEGQRSETKLIIYTSTPQKASLKKVANDKKGRITVRVNETHGAAGYQVQIATNKKFTKSKNSFSFQGTKMNFYKKTKKTAPEHKVPNKYIKLSKNKTYYVRVRAIYPAKFDKYNYIDNDEIIYGKWSSLKRVKIKK